MCFDDMRFTEHIRSEMRIVASTVIWGTYLPPNINRVGFIPIGGSEVHSIMPGRTTQPINTGYSIAASLQYQPSFLWRDYGKLVQVEWFVSGFNPGVSVNVVELTVPNEVMREIAKHTFKAP